MRWKGSICYLLGCCYEVMTRGELISKGGVITGKSMVSQRERVSENTRLLPLTSGLRSVRRSTRWVRGLGGLTGCRGCLLGDRELRRDWVFDRAIFSFWRRSGGRGAH